MTVYTIVNARRRDLDAIGAIELAAAQLLRGHAPDAVLAEVTSEHELIHAQREGCLWVALANDVPVGFALVRRVNRRIVHLVEIDVHPDHGRRGLGRRLVARVCSWAEEHRFRAVTLTTFRDVTFNMPFYARLGFEEIPAAALSRVLRSVLREEMRRGLDTARRVAMRKLAGQEALPYFGV